MLCRDVMKSKVQCLGPTDTVQDAACRMRDRAIGFLPVCDDQGHVLGTVTDRDLAIRVIADGRAPTDTVDAIMTTDVVSCQPEDDLEYAQELMCQHHKSRIVVADELGALVGVISLSDIAMESDGPSAVNTLREVSSREVHI